MSYDSSHRYTIFGSSTKQFDSSIVPNYIVIGTTIRDLITIIDDVVLVQRHTFMGMDDSVRKYSNVSVHFMHHFAIYIDTIHSFIGFDIYTIDYDYNVIGNK